MGGGTGISPVSAGGPTLTRWVAVGSGICWVAGDGMELPVIRRRVLGGSGVACWYCWGC